MSATPYTVTELTTLVGNALAARPELEDVLVEGEISNLTRPSSGHLYFTLKDRSSALSCVCFRTNALRVPFAPENGMTVVAHGQVSVYSQQGRYQLVVDRLEPSGVGALALAVEQRKRALLAEGLFDARLKRPLPLLPARVAVVTSRTGAALHDVVTVWDVARPASTWCSRLPPCRATGRPRPSSPPCDAPDARAASRSCCWCAAGGSLEDLMAFNDEAVARAIRACPVPVVSGVGHETDVTIADLAADHRAATPSAAAETVAPSCGQLRGELGARERRLRAALRGEVTHKRERARRRSSRLDQLSPAVRVARMRQDLHARDVRLRGALSRRHQETARSRASAAWRRSPCTRRCGPCPSIVSGLAARRHAWTRRASVNALMTARGRHLDGVRGRLEALSPLRVIDRGYSITVDAATGGVITRSTEVAPGAVLRTRLARGSLVSRVLPDGVEVAPGDERMYDDRPGQRRHQRGRPWLTTSPP